ncbi:UNVERIFIED_CONTAM: hypothetical protein HDU68_006592 [Siphonaria sp. JEL0065]|nr:hypothetical protein HDU68_006592 [Siphonaria sp. JEL0065]
MDAFEQSYVSLSELDAIAKELREKYKSIERQLKMLQPVAEKACLVLTAAGNALATRNIDFLELNQELPLSPRIEIDIDRPEITPSTARKPKQQREKISDADKAAKWKTKIDATQTTEQWAIDFPRAQEDPALELERERGTKKPEKWAIDCTPRGQEASFDSLELAALPKLNQPPTRQSLDTLANNLQHAIIRKKTMVAKTRQSSIDSASVATTNSSPHSHLQSSLRDYYMNRKPAGFRPEINVIASSPDGFKASSRNSFSSDAGTSTRKSSAAYVQPPPFLSVTDDYFSSASKIVPEIHIVATSNTAPNKLSRCSSLDSQNVASDSCNSLSVNANSNSGSLNEFPAPILHRGLTNHSNSEDPNTTISPVLSKITAIQEPPSRKPTNKSNTTATTESAQRLPTTGTGNTALNAGPEKTGHLSHRSHTILRAITKAITVPNYNPKGSLASIALDVEEMSNGDVKTRRKSMKSSYMHFKSSWRDGINHLSLFSVYSQLFISFVYLIELWIIPFSIGFNVSLPIEFSIFITIVYAFDVALELACVLFLCGRMYGYSNWEIEVYEEVEVVRQYIWALMIAVSNTFPVGYKPSYAVEQWFVITFCIIGAGLFATIVGTVSSLAMGFDASGRLYKEKLDELREYMRWKDLDSLTRRKILKYFDLKYRGKYFEEATLLSDLNESLRMEIAAHNCRNLISKVSFLRRQQNDGRDELFLGKIATSFVTCYFVTGDILFTQGQPGQEMYFILSGKVNVLVHGKRVATLKEGAFFGEIALIANIPRTATVQAATSCMLYRLTRTSFTSILEEFEDVKRTVDVIYRERMEKIKFEEEARKLMIAKDLVDNVPFLNRCENDGRDQEFLLKIAGSLSPIYLVAGDVVFTQGEMGNEMYFIKNGTIDIIVEGDVVSSLSEGSFFGEVALIANIPRTATAKSRVTSIIYRLTRESFKTILQEFEDMKQRMDEVYQERMSRVRKEEQHRLSRVPSVKSSVPATALHGSNALLNADGRIIIVDFQI